VAGTTNYKRKYEPEFPTVTISDTAPGRIMTAAELEALQLVAPPEPVIILPSPPARVSQRSEAAIRARKWPDYGRCIQSAPPNQGNTGPDTSRADFTWCITALDWGFDIPDYCEAYGAEQPGKGERAALCCFDGTKCSRSAREKRTKGGQGVAGAFPQVSSCYLI
jgi:hypothetical protein